MTPEEQLHQLNPPPEVVALGKPDNVVLLTRHWGSIHSPLARWLSDGHLIAGCSLVALAAFLALMGMIAVQKRAPFSVLQIAFGGAVVSLAGGAGFLLTRKPGTRHGDVHYAYAYYPDALVYLEAGNWKIIRWTDIVEYVGNSPGSPEARVKLQDGTEVTLRKGFGADAGVLMEVERRSLAPLMERAAAALGAGRSVAFGPLSVSQRGLTYSGNSFGDKLKRFMTQDVGSEKTLAWDDIERIEVVPDANHYGGLVGGMQALHLRLKIGRRSQQGWTLMWGKMGEDKGRWFNDRFLTIPNRLVLLALLCAWRPAQTKVEVAGLISLYMPWHADWEHKSPSLLGVVPS
jgi:hypothetical protein